jgi:hypothetical protein
MSQSLKRLERIEAALSQLMAKDKVYIVWHHKVETQEEAIESAIAARYFNPSSQEAVLIRSNIPRKTIYHQEWSSEIPRGPYKRETEEIARTSPAPRFEGTYPDQPVEPKPERRVRIRYPNYGIV